MSSHDFFCVKIPSKFDGLNFPSWKVKMTLFFKCLRFRVAQAVTKEYIEPHGDEDTWSEATASDYEANTKA